MSNLDAIGKGEVWYKVYVDASVNQTRSRLGVRVERYVDGQLLSARGYSFIIDKNEKSINRLELLAAIHGLNLVPDHSKVELYSDSSYVINVGFYGKKIRKNRDLIARLNNLITRKALIVKPSWIPRNENEEADKLSKGD